MDPQPDPPLSTPLSRLGASDDWTDGSSEETEASEPERADPGAPGSRSAAAEDEDGEDEGGEGEGEEDAAEPPLDATTRARRAREQRVARESLEAKVVVAGALLGGVTVIVIMLLFDLL